VYFWLDFKDLRGAGGFLGGGMSHKIVPRQQGINIFCRGSLWLINNRRVHGSPRKSTLGRGWGGWVKKHCRLPPRKTFVYLNVLLHLCISFFFFLLGKNARIKIDKTTRYTTSHRNPVKIIGSGGSKKQRPPCFCIGVLFCSEYFFLFLLSQNVIIKIFKTTCFTHFHRNPGENTFPI